MTRYKIVRVQRKTGNKRTIETRLTLQEAQRYIQRDINSGASTQRSMLVFYKQ